MAPERFHDGVVPVKSDMFSMGIIASELLQGHHPAGNLKKVLTSEGKWLRWVSGRERNLQGIESRVMKSVIERCLDPDPDLRPQPLEMLDAICAELETAYGLEIADTLRLWRSEAGSNVPVAQAEHLAWAAM
jgi:serine/threonine protein kinase